MKWPLIKAAAVLLLFCGPKPSFANSATAMFVAPSGFYLQPSDKKKRGQLYGPTSPQRAANWNISQWDIPQDLPPFNRNNISQNRWARVSFKNDVLTIAEDSKNYPCTKLYPSGYHLPKEWGMFAAPNSTQEPQAPQAGLDIGELISNVIDINLKTTLTLKSLRVLDDACHVNKAFFVADIVLTNKLSSQILFYGVSFGNFLTTSRGDFQQNGVLSSQSHGTMYFNGVNRESGSRNFYGYGDPVDSTYDVQKITPGKTVSYNLNLLPHLIQAIRAGKSSGLDQNLEHWSLRGFYEGQTITGHVFVESKWSNFSLVINKKN